MSLDYNESNKIHKKSIAIKTLYLIDDNFNTFEHVIDCLVAICDHSPIQAEQCALLTHINGKCDILVEKFLNLNHFKKIGTLWFKCSNFIISKNKTAL